MSLRALLLTGSFLFVGLASHTVYALDEAAAQALMKKSNCFKCHSIDKKKVGTAFKEIAKKYQDKAEAEQKLYTHLTTNTKVKIDGKEEQHEPLKTKNEADIRSVVQWILAL